jgi:hypothetical protein
MQTAVAWLSFNRSSTVLGPRTCVFPLMSLVIQTASWTYMVASRQIDIAIGLVEYLCVHQLSWSKIVDPLELVSSYTITRLLILSS